MVEYGLGVIEFCQKTGFIASKKLSFCLKQEFKHYGTDVIVTKVGLKWLNLVKFMQIYGRK